MKKKFWVKLASLATGALLLMSIVSVAAAAVEHGHFKSSGRSANAGWTECTATSPTETTCTDTFIGASDVMYRENGTKYPSKMIYYNQYTYKYDTDGNYYYLSAVYGIGSGNISIDKKLNSASASGVLPIDVCTVDMYGNEICAPGGTVDVSAQWTGFGPTERNRSSYQYSSGGFTAKGQFRGSFRQANATATVNGNSLGTAFFANLMDARSMDMYIFHN